MKRVHIAQKGQTRSGLCGIIPALLTPLDKKGAFSPKGMNSLCKYLLEQRVNGLFVLGSAGEAPTFSLPERDEIIRTVVHAVDGQVPVLVGVGQNSTESTLAHVNQAAQNGADYVVALPPMWRRQWITEEGLFEHYKTLAQKSRLPILPYNLPSEACSLSPSLVQRLAGLKNIVGIKDSSGCVETISAYAEHLPVFQGDDTNIFAAFQAGAVGAISGMANIIAAPFVSLYEKWFSCLYSKLPDWQQADEAHTACQECRLLEATITAATKKVLSIPVNPLAVEKYCLEVLGVCKTGVRRPYQDLSRSEKMLVVVNMPPYLTNKAV